MTARIRPLLHRLGWRLWTYGRPGPFLVVEFPNGAEQASTGTVAGLIAGLAEWFNGACPGVCVGVDIEPVLPAQPPRHGADPRSLIPPVDFEFGRQRRADGGGKRGPKGGWR